jgi:SAM-dependent methyltransferase
MPLKALKALLTHLMARSVNPNSAEYYLIRAYMIQQEKLLKRIYLNWYRILAKSIPQDTVGIALEIGSSTGFSKQVISGVVTSDIVDISAVDMAVDGQYLPFRKDSLRGIIMVDVFHHIPDVERFLRDVTRCVRTGGVIAMIEP